VATFSVSLLVELGACTDLFSEFPVVEEAAAQQAESFSRMSAVPVVSSVEELRRTALVS
jgi:hypothetical protein